jgi:hypothetical protein
MVHDLELRTYEWECMYFLADRHDAIGDYKLAAKLYPKVIDFKDSIFSPNKNATTEDFQSWRS